MEGREIIKGDTSALTQLHVSSSREMPGKLWKVGVSHCLWQPCPARHHCGQMIEQKEREEQWLLG